MEESIKNDRYLIHNVLSNQSGAFEQLIKDYQRLVGHIVFRMISNKGEIEYLCQEIFIKIYQNLTKFHFESKLSTWIAKITFNTCLNYLEKKKTSIFSDILDDETFEKFAGDAPIPDESVENEDVSHKLKKEIENLPVLYRTILTLYHLDELSYNEIGTITKLPEGTVKNYLFRARKLLKNRLVSKYSEEDLCR